MQTTAGRGTVVDSDRRRPGARTALQRFQERQIGVYLCEAGTPKWRCRLGREAVVAKTIKRDDYCIWFSHLAPDLSSVLADLHPDEPLTALVNGHTTTWRRMRPGARRPTMGIKIDEGRSIWEQIHMGAVFDFRLAGPAEQSPAVPIQPATQTPLTASAEPHSVGEAVVDSTGGGSLFGAYLFADYSGAEGTSSQRKAIKAAHAERWEQVRLLAGSFTRDSLVDEVVRVLGDATARGVRVCLGQDHMYGVPLGLAEELGIDHRPWRKALELLTLGAYDHPHAPAFAPPRLYGKRFNNWLQSRGRPPYFWSATKHELYGLPRTNPRHGDPKSVWRITERSKGEFSSRRPMPFNRLGDPGTVGGQSLFGLPRLLEVMTKAESVGLRLRCWPFDGLDILDPAYEGAHVLVEVYPSALRPPHIRQTDENDALCSVVAVQQEDLRGTLPRRFDLSGLSAQERDVVRFEGWILGVRPV